MLLTLVVAGVVFTHLAHRGQAVRVVVAQALLVVPAQLLAQQTPVVAVVGHLTHLLLRAVMAVLGLSSFATLVHSVVQVEQLHQ